jgi:long-chain fatty acid transport protein
MRFQTCLALLTVLLVSAGPAMSSSFSIFENGVRASGMAGAFVAIANDGSAIFYNPAGIAFQKGNRMEMDSLGVIGLFRFFPSDTPPGTIVPEKGFNLNVRPHLIPVMSMFMTKEVSPKMTFGFGMFAPFGLAANATNFKDSDPTNIKYVGRFAGTRAALQSFWLQPTVAYKLTPNSSIGIGIAWVHTHLLIERSLINPLDDGKVFGAKLASKIFPGVDPGQASAVIARLLPEGRSKLSGTSNSPGFNAGYIWKNDKTKTSVGLMWRSAVTHHLDGWASFAFTTGYPLESFIGKNTIPDLFPAQAIKGQFTTPATYSIGIANSAFFKSTIAVQLDIQDYGRFKDVPVNFSQTEDSGTALPKELKLPFRFGYSYLMRVGLERNIGEKNTVRIGYFYDHSPVTDFSVGPLFPDSSRNNLTFGLSHIMGGAEFSFFYQAMWMLQRTTDVTENKNQFTNGTYSNFVHLVGLGMRLRLGEKTNPFDR